MDPLAQARAAIMRQHSPSQMRGVWSPRRPVTPTRYARYLAESRIVHLALDAEDKPRIAPYADILERDVEDARDRWGLDVPDVEFGPGTEYARFLADETPQRLLCHWWCLHFALLAGGRAVAGTLTQTLGWTPRYFDAPDPEVAKAALEYVRERADAEFATATTTAFAMQMAVLSVLE